MEEAGEMGRRSVCALKRIWFSLAGHPLPSSRQCTPLFASRWRVMEGVTDEANLGSLACMGMMLDGEAIAKDDVGTKASFDCCAGA